jgi:hypothetical protein
MIWSTVGFPAWRLKSPAGYTFDTENDKSAPRKPAKVTRSPHRGYATTPSTGAAAALPGNTSVSSRVRSTPR